MMTVKKSAIPWDKLDKLQKPHKLGILAATIALLGALFFFLFFQPLQMKTEGIRGDIDRLENLILQHRIKARRIPKAKERLEDVRLRFAFARRLLPETKEVDLLLKSISDKGAQSGLNVLLFQPDLKDTLRDFYAEIAFNMKVEGPYLNVATFFYRLGRLPRIVNISDIRMSGPKIVEGEVILTTTCRGTTFRFLTPKEQEEVAAEKLKKTRGRRRRR